MGNCIEPCIYDEEQLREVREVRELDFIKHKIDEINKCYDVILSWYNEIGNAWRHYHALNMVSYHHEIRDDYEKKLRELNDMRRQYIKRKDEIIARHTQRQNEIIKTL